MSAGDKFRIDLAAAIAKAKENSNSLVRKVLLDVGTRVVDRSPVGDKELWAINDLTQLQRDTFRTFHAEQQAITDPLINALDAYVRARPPKPASERRLKQMFQTKGPKNYVGGRFRANWQLQETSPPEDQLYQPDDASFPEPSQVIAAMDAHISNHAAGKKFYIMNNLPYAHRLEDGWSKQAPQGMVALTAVEFSAIVGSAVEQVKSGPQLPGEE